MRGARIQHLPCLPAKAFWCHTQAHPCEGYSNPAFYKPSCRCILAPRKKAFRRAFKSSICHTFLQKHSGATKKRVYVRGAPIQHFYTCLQKHFGVINKRISDFPAEAFWCHKGARQREGPWIPWNPWNPQNPWNPLNNAWISQKP